MVGPQLVELAPRVRHAAHLGHAEFEAGLVAAEVVGDELALPAGLVMRAGQAEEAAHVLAAPAVGEVEDDSLDRVERRRAVAPQVRPVGLAMAGLEHGHRCLVGVQHRLTQQFGREGVHQRLQLHAALAHPLRQRGAGDQVSGTLEDRFLAVQGQVVQVLGHQHLGQEIRGGQALVDDVRRHRRLDEPLTALAHPLAADVSFHREHARLVVQLLGHVFADALHWGATAAGGVLGLVVDLAARQVRWQPLALRYLLVACGLGRGLHALDLSGHRRQVAVQRLFQQALLFGAIGLALGGELQSLEDGVLVRELVDDGLLERDLGARGTQRLAQLFRIQRVEVFGDHGL